MGRARVLVVGGGLTAAALSYRLLGLPVAVTCWDKAMRPGGRMTTKRRGNTQIDLGPQFITRQYGEEEKIFKEFVNLGILRPLRLVDTSASSATKKSADIVSSSNGNIAADTSADNGGAVSIGVDDTIRMENKNGDLYLVKPDNFVAVGGSDEIVQHLWRKSEVTPLTQHNLDELNQADDLWLARSSANQKREVFDAVVFTQPVPQYINPHEESPEGRPQGNYLNHTIQHNNELMQQLQAVKYFSSFSLGILYDQRKELKLDWTMKYFPNNKIIRYVCVDSVRRGCPEEPTSICVQTQRAWSQQYLHLDKHAAAPIILEELRNLVGELPAPDHVLPHRWRYSQTAAPFPGSPGAVELQHSPLLIAAGDSFSVSNVEGCLFSARKAAALVRKWLQI